jgi:hypothetical protein
MNQDGIHNEAWRHESTGRDGQLAGMLQAMSPLDRGILLLTNSGGRIPALLAEMQLPVAYPIQRVREPGGVE